MKTALFWFALFVSMLAAWITHIVVCIKSAAWVLLAIGAFMFPVGIIHGYGVWFGAF